MHYLLLVLMLGLFHGSYAIQDIVPVYASTTDEDYYDDIYGADLMDEDELCDEDYDDIHDDELDLEYGDDTDFQSDVIPYSEPDTIAEILIETAPYDRTKQSQGGLMKLIEWLVSFFIRGCGTGL